MKASWIRGLVVGLAISGGSIGWTGEGSETLFQKLDTNQDGKLTADEVAQEHRGLFDRLLSRHDQDADGTLSATEFQSGTEAASAPRALEEKLPAGQPGERMKMMLQRLDANRDQAIDKGEVPEQMRPFFDRLLEHLDTNGDGTLERKEIEAQREQIAKFAQFAKAPGDGERGGRDGKRPEGAGKRPERDGKGPGPNAERRGPGEGRGDGPGGRGGFVEGIMRRLKELDTNNDEKISREEAEKAERLKPQFDKIDTNSDDFLDKEEIKKHLETMAGRPGGPAGRGGPGGGGDFAKQMAERLKKLDTNGDEQLSRNETKGVDRLNDHFDEIDANSDDILDKAEIKSHIEKMMQRFGGQQRGGPGQPREGNRPEAGRRGEGKPESQQSGRRGERRKPAKEEQPEN